MENFDKQNIEQDFYKTGSTKPPKNWGGLVAGLLVAVILLAGVSSVLGIMNIKLFRMLQTEEEESVSFAPTEPVTTAVGQETDNDPSGLGLTGDSIDELDQRFFGLPAGVLVSDVMENGCAARSGIAPGDIILSFNGVEVLNGQELQAAFSACEPGAEVEVVLYRYRTQQQLGITLVLED